MVMRSNLSEVARSASLSGKLILKEVGVELSQVLWDRFQTLVQETPQWTGTAAASWNIAMTGQATGVAVGGEYREQFLAKGESPLSKGHGHAVGIALAANSSFPAELPELYTVSDIQIWNASPTAEFAEYGPLRPEHETRGFQRFINDIQSVSLNVLNRELF